MSRTRTRTRIRLGRRRSIRSAAAATTATLVALGAAGAAQAACAPTTTTQAFKQFGDTSAYTLLSGGSFEAGAPGWTLTRASVVAGNETYRVRGAADAKSLAIAANGTAVSPAFCIGVEHPNFRFFAKRTSGSWGVMLVKLRYWGADKKVVETTVGGLSGTDFATWSPSRSVALATVTGLWQAGQSVTGQLVFDPDDGGGNWAIDDVFVDPRSRS